MIDLLPAVAVDIGATNMRVARIDAAGRVVQKLVRPTPCEGADPLVVPRQAAAMIRELLDGDLRAIEGIGVSAASPVDRRTGSMVSPPNLPFAAVPLAGPLGEELGIPVRVANDCRAAVLAEARYGAGMGHADLVYVTISTGIGGGVVLGGRLLEGRDGNAGEIGHLTVDTRYVLPCGCGGSGHWESYASGRSIPTFYRVWRRAEDPAAPGPAQPSCASIFAAARAGDGDARRFLDELGKINGRGLSGILAAYNPSIVVLDGPVVRENQSCIIPPMLRRLDPLVRRPEVVISPLAGDAPLIGAILLPRHP